MQPEKADAVRSAWNWLRWSWAANCRRTARFSPSGRRGSIDAEGAPQESQASFEFQAPAEDSRQESDAANARREPGPAESGADGEGQRGGQAPHGEAATDDQAQVELRQLAELWYSRVGG